jgi:hypothetical protein
MAQQTLAETAAMHDYRQLLVAIHTPSMNMHVPLPWAPFPSQTDRPAAAANKLRL